MQIVYDVYVYHRLIKNKSQILHFKINFFLNLNTKQSS